MPGFDRTGPEGYGPLTGRRMGFCRPIGRRMHRGFWNRPFFRGQPRYRQEELPSEYTVQELEHQKELLREELRAIKQELDTLQKKEEL